MEGLEDRSRQPYTAEDKIKVVDEIVKLHPALGVEKGWSHYTGGMKDSGGWDYRKMLDEHYVDLHYFFNSNYNK